MTQTACLPFLLFILCIPVEQFILYHHRPLEGTKGLASWEPLQAVPAFRSTSVVSEMRSLASL